jgi:DNA-binding NarL/FixJ family response regulator
VTVAVATDRQLLAAAFASLLRSRGVDVLADTWVIDDLATRRRRLPDVLVVLTRMATVEHDAAQLHTALAAATPPALAVVILDDVARCAPLLLAAGCTVVVPATVPSATLTEAVEAAVSGERFVHPEALAAALGGLRGGPGRPVRELTPRELDVLRLVAAGRTNAAIGVELGVAASTVKTHIASLLDKLEAHDRAHAVAIGLRTGLIR